MTTEQSTESAMRPLLVREVRAILMRSTFKQCGLVGSEDKQVDLVCFYDFSLEYEAITFVSCNNTPFPKHMSKCFSGAAVCVSRVGCCI